MARKYIGVCAIPTLTSPGVSVSIIDESQYAPASQGTIPLFIIATASNKESPTAGAGLAPQTLKSQAGILFLATSQRDLIQNYGNPIFYNIQGTPLHGFELNEYGLWSAYSYLGINNQAYILRADLDLAELMPSVSEPFGPPLAGTYWLNLGNTQWGVFRANGSTSPGAAWNNVQVIIPSVSQVDVNDVPLSSFGSSGNIAVVPWTASNFLYENVGGNWHKIGSTDWKAVHPTVVRGVVVDHISNGTGTSIVINTVTVTVTSEVVADLVVQINDAAISNITASLAVNGSLIIQNVAGNPITIANGTGTPLASLGILAKTYGGVSVIRNTGPSYPDGSIAGSLWVKGNVSNKGASWAIQVYNGTLGQWLTVTAPFYQFNSALLDGDAAKDMAAIAAIPNPVTGTLYVGFDPTTGDQQIRLFAGNWQSLVYEADVDAPNTAPAAGTLWYNTNFAVDIMYGTGESWLGYRHKFPFTDIDGPQIDGSAPLTQRNGAPLVENDLWINSTDLEDYPSIYRWSVIDQTWQLIDSSDQTTPFGIIFRDARTNSGTTFTNIANTGDYSFLSTAPQDMALSDFVEPDAPDPRTFPSGMLLYNTRYSTYNVKSWNPLWFKIGGADPNTDFTNTPYNIGDPSIYAFPPITYPGVWVTNSGNSVNGSPYSGRKAQRVEIVRALAAQVNANQDIRSELVFFNLMAAPGYPELIPEFISLNADMNGTAFCVADTPIRLVPEGSAIQGWANNASNVAADGEDGLVTGNYNTGIYYPWGLSTNLDGSEIMIPASAIALVTMAFNDQVAYPWYAPAGFNRGLVTNASSVGYLNSEGEYTPTILNQGQRDVIYANRINPIAYIPQRGLVVFGQKTLSPIASALDRVNVARLINYISYQLDVILKPFLFEQNIATTRQSALSVVERFFNQLVGLNGLYDYSVVCDLSNNSPDRIDRNELWVDCAVQPVKAIEFIYVPVRILTTQATTGF